MYTNHPRYGFFSAADRAFLERMFTDHAGLAEKFDLFLEIPADQRLALAHDILKTTPRSGWVKRQVKDPETVFQHLNDLAIIMQEVDLPGDLQGMSESDARQRLESMARNHDVPEAIATDFTPTCPITSEDKTHLELLAARVIFEEQPHEMGLMEEYCAQETPLSHLLHDFDKLSAVFKALEYEGIYPEKRGKLYNEFRDYAVPRLKTDCGRNHAGSIEHHAETIRQTARQQYLQEKFAGMRF